HIIAIPFGIALLYHDTWLPPFSRLLAQPEVLQFSNDYLLELLGRLINWELVGAGFIALVVYLLLSQWLRMTFFTMLAITVLSLIHWSDIWLPQGARLFAQATWAGLTTQALNSPPADTLPRTTAAAHQDSVSVPA